MLTWIGVSWRTASSGRRGALQALDGLAPDCVAVHTCARDPASLRAAQHAVSSEADEVFARLGGRAALAERVSA